MLALDDDGDGDGDGDDDHIKYIHMYKYVRKKKYYTTKKIHKNISKNKKTLSLNIDEKKIIFFLLFISFPHRLTKKWKKKDLLMLTFKKNLIPFFSTLFFSLFYPLTSKKFFKFITCKLNKQKKKFFPCKY